jgi:hypothetical protein
LVQSQLVANDLGHLVPELKASTEQLADLRRTLSKSVPFEVAAGGPIGRATDYFKSNLRRRPPCTSSWLRLQCVRRIFAALLRGDRFEWRWVAVLLFAGRLM